MFLLKSSDQDTFGPKGVDDNQPDTDDLAATGLEGSSGLELQAQAPDLRREGRQPRHGETNSSFKEDAGTIFRRDSAARGSLSIFRGLQQGLLDVSTTRSSSLPYHVIGNKANNGPMPGVFVRGMRV